MFPLLIFIQGALTKINVFTAYDSLFFLVEIMNVHQIIDICRLNYVPLNMQCISSASMWDRIIFMKGLALKITNHLYAGPCIEKKEIEIWTVFKAM